MKSWFDTKFKWSGLLLLTFLLSVLIRIPNLNRPLSKHHEFVTAISLRILQVWEQEGALRLGFNPAMNYAGEVNKHIDNHATSLHKLVDEEGNFYYTSHPPFAYILPYLGFQSLGLSATVLNLQVFHLIVHFLSAFLIVLIIRSLGGNRNTQYIGFLTYCFLPATLWFQSNTYMSDMLVHFFFLAGIWTLIELKRRPTLLRLLSLLVITFLMTYTSWLAVFFAFSGGIFSLLYLKEFRWKTIAILFIGTCCGVGLMFGQYASIAGFDVFWEQLTQRFSARGSNTSEATHSFFVEKAKEIGLLGFNYAVNYFSLLGICIVLLIGKFRGRLETPIFANKPFVLIALLPILLLHLVLLNYSGHDFTTLYVSGFVAVAVAFFLSSLAVRAQIFHAALIVGLGCAVYLWINRPGEIGQNGDRYNEFAMQGEFIHTTAAEDEVVFWIGKELDPMTIVYAKRNIIEIDQEADAYGHLQRKNVENGVIVSVKSNVMEAKKIGRRDVPTTD